MFKGIMKFLKGNSNKDSDWEERFYNNMIKSDREMLEKYSDSEEMVESFTLFLEDDLRQLEEHKAKQLENKNDF